MKQRALVAIVVLLSVIGFAAWWFRPESPTQSAPIAAPASAIEKTETAAATPAVAESASAPAPPETPMPAWENQIDQVLRSNVTESQTAQILLNMLPTLPEEGQVEAAQHITNLLSDEDYAKAKPFLLNPNTPEPVLSVFFTDLMNRADSVKLPAFLDIAKLPNHPFHEEALSDLQIFLGDDYGTDWAKWNAALEGYLKASAAQ